MSRNISDYIPTQELLGTEADIEWISWAKLAHEEGPDVAMAIAQSGSLPMRYSLKLKPNDTTVVQGWFCFAT